MAKTITLQDTKIQSIILTNNSFNGDETGYSSIINYGIADSSENVVMHKTSLKFTSDANNSNDKMSEVAETHLNAYLVEMEKLMDEREEL